MDVQEDQCSSSRLGPPMDYLLLKHLNKNSPNNCRIRTRIARLWEHRKRSNNYLVGLRMVLVDEEGQGIDAFVPAQKMPSFKEQLKGGRVYYFQHFKTSLVPSRKTHRSVCHSCNVCFTEETKVKPIVPEPDDFPPYAYSPRSFKEILDKVEDKKYLADVVGLVKGISNIMTFKRKPKRTVCLYDGRNYAMIHLWGELADKLDADKLIRRSESEPVILLAMGCTFKEEYSMLSLKPAFGCRICINPASDVLAFRNRIIGTDHSIKRIDDKGHLVVENTSVINLVSEGSSSGAGHTGSCVDAVSASDPVAERTVSAAQEHNAELSRTPIVGKKRATPTPPGDVLATPSDMKKKTRSSSRGGDNPRELTGEKKKKSDENPNGPKKTPNAFFVFRGVFRRNYKLAHPYTHKENKINEEAGKKWNSMTDDEKAPYFSKARGSRAYNSSQDAAAPAVDDDEPLSS